MSQLAATVARVDEDTLPQHDRHAIVLLKDARQNPELVEFAMANLFRSRAASGYEARAAAMAANLADGLTPGQVKAFRTQLLKLHRRPDLSAAVYQRLPAAVGPVRRQVLLAR